jgi:hypothetical protein
MRLLGKPFRFSSKALRVEKGDRASADQIRPASAALALKPRSNADDGPAKECPAQAKDKERSNVVHA